MPSGESRRPQKSAAAEAWLVNIETWLNSASVVKAPSVVYVVAWVVSAYGSLVSILAVVFGVQPGPSDASLARPIRRPTMVSRVATRGRHARVDSQASTRTLGSGRPAFTSSPRPSLDQPRPSIESSRSTSDVDGAPRCKVKGLLSFLSPNAMTTKSSPCCPVVDKMSASSLAVFPSTPHVTATLTPPGRSSTLSSEAVSNQPLSSPSTSTSASIACSIFSSSPRNSLSTSPSSTCSIPYFEQEVKKLKDAFATEEFKDIQDVVSPEMKPLFTARRRPDMNKILFPATSRTTDTSVKEGTFPADYVPMSRSDTCPGVTLTGVDEIITSSPASLTSALMTKTESESSSKVGIKKRFWRRVSLGGSSRSKLVSTPIDCTKTSSPPSSILGSQPTSPTASGSKQRPSLRPLLTGSGLSCSGKKSRRGSGVIVASSVPSSPTTTCAPVPLMARTTSHGAEVVIVGMRRKRTVWGGSGHEPMDWRDDGNFIVSSPTRRRVSESGDGEVGSYLPLSMSRSTSIGQENVMTMRRISTGGII